MPMAINRGDAFVRAGQFAVAADGINVGDMTGWSVRCQVRTQTGELVEELEFAWLDAAQRLFRLTSGDTTGWPVGTHVFDMQLTTPAGERITGPKDLLITSQGATE
jgi:hypothetical protein